MTREGPHAKDAGAGALELLKLAKARRQILPQVLQTCKENEIVPSHLGSSVTAAIKN